MSTKTKTKTECPSWSHLPNAKHIDWVLASLKENPKAWDAAWDAAWNAAQGAARYAARYAAWDAAWYAAWNAAQTPAWTAAWNAAQDAARTPAWDVIAALVAYDHCEKYLRMTPDELYVWWKLSDDPACMLLMPMVKVQTEKEMT